MKKVFGVWMEISFNKNEPLMQKVLARKEKLFLSLYLYFMVPSSSGLGRGPLKAATRVRISLGSPMQAAGIKTAVFLL